MKTLITLAVVLAASAAVAQDLACTTARSRPTTPGTTTSPRRPSTSWPRTPPTPRSAPRASTTSPRAFSGRACRSRRRLLHSIVKAGKDHPFYLKAVEGLVNVQELLDDQYLIPSILNRVQRRVGHAAARGAGAHQLPDRRDLPAQGEVRRGPRLPRGGAEGEHRLRQGPVPARHRLRRSALPGRSADRRGGEGVRDRPRPRREVRGSGPDEAAGDPRPGPHLLRPGRVPEGDRGVRDTSSRASPATGTRRCSRTASPASRTTTSAARWARCRRSTRRSSPAPSSPSRGSSRRPSTTSAACTTSAAPRSSPSTRSTCRWRTS